jgi:cytoskeletal protein CcmA (bactofilin family)
MPSRSRRIFGIGLLLAAVALPAAPLLGSIRTSGRIIVTADDVVREDLYAVGNRTIVEGVVQGDLVVLTSELIVTGRVEGDVVGLVGGTARIGGTVDGSVLLGALRLEVAGVVEGDVAALAGDASIAADVRRDVLVIGGEAVVGGRVGRDVRAQAWSLGVHGEVGRDLVARVDDLTVGSGAAVAGDILYKASDRVDLAESAAGGQVSERRVLSPVWAKAAARAFAWLSLLGFLLGSFMLFWLFRATAERSVWVVGRSPWRAGVVGLGVVLVPPLLTLPLAVSLVGLPVAVLLLVAWLALLVLGPAPAVAWAGRRILAGRGTAYGALFVGALLWRGAMWLFGLVAGLVYVAALLVGTGSFAIAAWEGRRRGDGSWRPLPPH